MLLASTFLPILLSLVFFQSPQDTLRQHYEAAEAQRLAGNLSAAEAEYAAILADGYARLGKTYAAQAKYKEAISALEASGLYQPESEEALIELAIAYFGAGQYEKGLVPLQKVVARNSQNVGAHHMLGKTYFMLGESAKAAGELETALNFAPHDVDVAYTLGIAYLVNHRVDSAKQLFDRMLKEFGDQPQLHIVIGRAYRESGLLPEAIAEFRKAIALDPGFPRAHYYLGLTYLLDEGQSKLSEALAEFKIELTANPDEYFANYYLGIAYIFQRKWDLALSFFQRASTIQPNNPDPYYQLGQAYQELGKHEQAIEVLKKSIALNPFLAHNKYQVTTAHHRLAQSLLKTGQAEAGQRELQVAADLKAEAFRMEQRSYKGAASSDASTLAGSENRLGEKGAVEGSVIEPSALDEKATRELKSSEAYYTKVVAAAHNNVGLLRAERQDFNAAAEQFALAAKWDPQQEGLDYNLGLAYYKSDSYKQAVPPLENELRLHPDNRPATMLLGMTWFRLRSYAKASELLSGVIDPQPADVNIFYALASSLIKQGKVVAADRVITRMETTAGAAPQLQLLRAEKYSTSGVTAKALAELNEVATLNTNIPLVHYYSGLLYLKLNKRDEAAREFEREVALNPHDIQARYSLGDVLLAGQNLERGLALIRGVLQAQPEHAEARYALGKALLQRGDTAGAIDNLEQASKLEPENPEFHFHLGQAYVAAGRKTAGKNQIEISKHLRGRNQTTANDN
ncbi:MAG: Tetratricopeptide repeat protein [Acidobacteria bacterium]|nr:Tetratricopeptide repeat protein [Acidobacteriota bacterium]